MLDLFNTIFIETNHSLLNDLFKKMVNNLTGVYCYQNWSDGDNDGYPYWATGLSIYFPAYDYYNSEYTKDQYFYFPQDTYWPDLLWKFYLQPTNTDPVISVINPTQTKVSIFETQEIEFNVSATDSEGNYLRYYWFIDDEFIGQGNTLTISTDFGDAGSYTIDCVVADGAWNGIPYGLTGYDMQSWTLNILEDEEKPVVMILDSWNERPFLDRYNIFEVKVTDNVEVEEVNIITDFLSIDESFNITIEEKVKDIYSILYFVPEEGFPEQRTDPGWHNVTFTACDTAGNWVVYPDVPYYLNDIFDPVVVLDSNDEIDQHQIYTFDGSRCTDNWKIVNYTWRFNYNGEEVILYSIDPVFLFDIAGTYPVNLTIGDPDGNSAWGIINIEVRDVDNPFIDAGEDVVVDQHQAVSFNGDDSQDNVGIINWTWSFQYDGSTVNIFGEFQKFVFDNAGIYNISVTVKDEAGNTASDYFIVTVNDITEPEINIEPMIVIEQHENPQFDGSSCTDNVGIVNWTWFFEYNEVDINLYGEIQEFTFHEAGIYNISLTLKDEAGNTVSGFFLVAVNDITDPVIDLDHLIIINQHDVLRLDGSSCSDNVAVTNYTWSFTLDYEFFTLYGLNPDFTFHNSGEIKITLIIEDDAGNSASGLQRIRILDVTAPTANITFEKIGEDPVEYSFDGSGSNDNVGIIHYNWTISFNDNESDKTGENIDHTFNEPGTYIVTLEVCDLMGLCSTETVTITIVKPDEPIDDDADTDSDDDMDDDRDSDVEGEDSEDKGLSSVMILMIIVGVVILLGILGVLTLIFIVKKKEPEEGKMAENSFNSQSFPPDDT